MAEDTFGERVRALRVELGLSQDELAQRMPAPHHLSWVSGIERGLQEPSLDDLTALAQALKVDVRWLLTGEASGMSEFVARMAELEADLDGRAIRLLIRTAIGEIEEKRQHPEG